MYWFLIWEPREDECGWVMVGDANVRVPSSPQHAETLDVLGGREIEQVGRSWWGTSDVLKM